MKTLFLFGAAIAFLCALDFSEATETSSCLAGSITYLVFHWNFLINPKPGGSRCWRGGQGPVGGCCNPDTFTCFNGGNIASDGYCVNLGTATSNCIGGNIKKFHYFKISMQYFTPNQLGGSVGAGARGRLEVAVTKQHVTMPITQPKMDTAWIFMGSRFIPLLKIKHENIGDWKSNWLLRMISVLKGSAK